MIRIGPSGIGTGPIERLRELKKLALDAAEVEFGHNIYMNNEAARKIGEEAKRLGMSLSIHAPYYINLASHEEKKIENSKKYILECCERGRYLNAKYIVVHVAYYGKHSKEGCYKLVKEAILELQDIIKENKWGVVLCPETTGRVSQFGTIEELTKLSKETKCGLCVDFAHIYARNLGNIDYDYVCKKIKNVKNLTAHFAGIRYGAKGEINHLLTPEDKIEELLRYLIKHDINIRIINESPDPLGDSLKTKNILERLTVQ